MYTTDAGIPADHQLNQDREPYHITTDNLDNIDEGVSVVKDYSSGNVVHSPPNSDYCKKTHSYDYNNYKQANIALCAYHYHSGPKYLLSANQ